MKGSYTVEVSLLMSLLIPILVGILYLGYSVHNEAWAYGKASQEVLEESGMIREKSPERITKTIKRTMQIPPLARKFLRIEGSVEQSYTLKNENPAKTVFRLHSLKKLTGGGES